MDNKKNIDLMVEKKLADLQMQKIEIPKVVDLPS